MRVVTTTADLRDALAAADADARSHGLGGAAPRGVVMTMGALHDGHLALIRAARAQCAQVVVTIFVNPLQFGAGEDLATYPRSLDADVALAATAGADVVFAPDVSEMYPWGQPSVTVDAGRLGDILEGAVRPGHFNGVLTVVLKLCQLTQPGRAYFGQKDAQQLALVRQMVRDFNVPVQVIAIPIVRDEDGLALSSRNAYLSASERVRALALSRAMRAGSGAASRGPEAALAAARAELGELDVDYLVLVEADSFTPVEQTYTGEALLAVAARVGSTRLLDNELIAISHTGDEAR